MSVVLVLLGIVALATLIVVHEGGHFLVARLCGMRVERFSIGFGNPLVSVKRGDTIFQIAPIPLGGFVQITGLNPHEDYDHNDPYVYPNRPKWMRLAVLVAGPAANYIAACFIALFVFSAYGMRDPQRSVVDKTVVGSVAEQAGLKPGDLILQANDTVLNEKVQVSDVILKSEGKPVLLKVMRDGQPLQISVTPKRDGGETGPYRIGIMLRPAYVEVPFGAAVKGALVLPATASVEMVKNLGQLFTFKQRPEFKGPVGITELLVERAKEGGHAFLELVMYLSIYLGVFNLLPFPALDGGRVLFLGINSLRSKDLNAKAEATVHMVGLALLLGLFVVVTFSDIKNLAWIKKMLN